MPQPQPKRPSFNQVEKLVFQLPLDMRNKLRQKLDDESWGQEWDTLVKEADQLNKGKPPISEEEIAAEIKSLRQDLKAGSAKSRRRH